MELQDQREKASHFMILDFLSADYGCLHDNDRCVFTMFFPSYISSFSSEAHITFKPGKNMPGTSSVEEIDYKYKGEMQATGLGTNGQQTDF